VCATDPSSMADDTQGKKVKAVMLEGGSWLEWAITHHRWFFVVFFLLPMNATFEAYLKLRHFWSWWTREAAPAKHRERVAEVQRQVSHLVKPSRHVVVVRLQGM
jgi:hypothetical protein